MEIWTFSNKIFSWLFNKINFFDFVVETKPKGILALITKNYGDLLKKIDQSHIEESHEENENKQKSDEQKTFDETKT